MTEPIENPPVDRPPAPVKSPFRKKMLTRSGEALELGGRALIGLGLIKGLLGDSLGGEPLRFTPLVAVLAVIGGVLVLVGIYLQAEAER